MEPVMRNQWLTAVGLLALIGGCGLLTEVEQLDNFVYTADNHGVTLEPEVEAVGFRGEIQLLGRLNTPNPCYRLRGDLESRGSRLTLHVSARSTGSPACLAILGAFRYQAGIQRLRTGTYELRVLHEFPDATWQTQELKVSVDVR
jgi:hypothetical protein